MEFMEKEYRAIAESFEDKHMIGNAMYVALNGDNRLKLSIGAHNNCGGVTGIEVKVINKAVGELDKVLLKFKDIGEEMESLQTQFEKYAEMFADEQVQTHGMSMTQQM